MLYIALQKSAYKSQFSASTERSFLSPRLERHSVFGRTKSVCHATHKPPGIAVFGLHFPMNSIKCENPAPNTEPVSSSQLQEQTLHHHILGKTPTPSPCATGLTLESSCQLVSLFQQTVREYREAAVTKSSESVSCLVSNKSTPGF